MRLEFDKFTLDPETGELRRDGELVKLKPQPAQVLTLLVSRAGTMVTREEIRRELWPDDTYVDFDLGINSCIRQIRQALGDDREEPRFVQTIPRKGYRFLTAAQPARTAAPRMGLIPWMGAAFVLLVTLWSFWPRPPESSSGVTHVTLPLVAPWQQSARPVLALSPDGSRIVYVSEEAGPRNLYMRRLDRREATLIPGTEHAHYPFFSPDGKWLGFWARRALRRVPVEGGEVVEMCPSRNMLGATWGADDTIVYAETLGPLLQCFAFGGERQQLTTVEGSEGEWAHVWPQFLPGQDQVLFTRAKVTPDVVLVSLETEETRVVIENGCCARYASSGHLVFVRFGAGIFAVPFDLRRLETTGPERAVLSGIETNPPTAAAQFSLSDNGTLAYVPDVAKSNNTLVWVDRDGTETPIIEERRGYSVPRLSPDGRRLAVSIREGLARDLHVLDLERGTSSKITNGRAWGGIWSPDGARIAFASDREGAVNVYVKAAHGDGEARRLTADEYAQWPVSWSPDGRHLLFTEFHPGDNTLLLSPDRKADPQLLLESAGQAAISPDGKWLAYSSEGEVFVRPFPGLGPPHQVSQGGGQHPVWARDTMELFYRSEVHVRARKMMAVEITSEPTFRASKPELLFEGIYEWSPYHIASFDVTADGQRFVMIQKEDTPAQINVVFNWFEELRSE